MVSDSAMEPQTPESRKLLAERDFHEPSCPRWFAVSVPDAACDCRLPQYVWAVEASAIERALAQSLFRWLLSPTISGEDYEQARGEIARLIGDAGYSVQQGDRQ